MNYDDDYLTQFQREMEEDIKNGDAIVIAPNNLPITVRTWDCKYMEHEHAEHPNYKFPISIHYIGNDPEMLSDIEKGLCEAPELHAVLYVDCAIVLTLYEFQYFIFYLKNGKGRKQDRYDNWKICDEDLAKLRLLGGRK
jgi:hypothetical protein